jgi:hypothetical protein
MIRLGYYIYWRRHDWSHTDAWKLSKRRTRYAPGLHGALDA